MGQIAHFWPPEWLIQSSPPHIEGHHRQLDNQCRDPMNNNKDCRVGQLTIRNLYYKYQSHILDNLNACALYWSHILDNGWHSNEMTGRQPVNVLTAVRLYTKERQSI